MSEFILEVTETSLDQDVLAAANPVLLDLWAPWCAPCRALAPVLTKLSGDYQGSLQIAKVDVEKYPDVQRRFNVRGIPTMILFRDGAELTRAVGVKSSEEMRRWLTHVGINPPINAPVPTMSDLDKPRWGAFYGDVELRDFLVARLKSRVTAERVKFARMPYWTDGTGSVSAALVGSSDMRVFEGITGMPASFACVLEFCVQSDLLPEEVDALLSSIPLGADLRTLAPQMMANLFNGGMGDWGVILGDAVLDALRQRWLTLVARTLAGLEVKRTEWQTLTDELDALRNTDQLPAREVHDAVIATLTSLSPLPPADDGGSWAHGMLLQGIYLQHVLAASLLGWGETEFGLERFRHSWFAEYEKQEPGGKFSHETLDAARSEWMRQHGERQRTHDAFLEKFAENMAPVTMRARTCLAGLLAGTTIVRAE